MMKPPEVVVATSREQLTALNEAWASCVDRASRVSVFLTGEWLGRWWAHYGAGRDLHLLVARRGERVVGLLPLYVERQSVAGLPARVLRFMGTGGDTSPDYLGAVVDDEGADETMEALCHSVASDRSWDVLQLSDMLEDSPFERAMEKACRERGILVHRASSGQIAVANPPPTWDEYLSTFSRDQRYSIRRQRRRLEEDHRARLFVWSDAANLDRAIDRLAELHRRRWEGRVTRHGFSSPEYLAFHRDVMKSCFAMGRLRLYCLEISGQIVAMQYCYAFRREISMFQSGFEPDLAHLRLGYVLTAWVIEQAIGEGMRVYDMLKGEHSYKAIWARDKRLIVRFSGYRRTPAGMLAVLRRELIPSWRRRFRREPAQTEAS